MTFADISPGVSLFVDANTLVYHFAADPLLGPAGKQLLDRIIIRFSTRWVRRLRTA
ncbi:MAG: hypothetical protein ACLQNE_34730 [Thermoguttaceae bacterium]|jgi:hypothetical protein